MSEPESRECERGSEYAANSSLQFSSVVLRRLGQSQMYNSSIKYIIPDPMERGPTSAALRGAVTI